MPTNVQCKKRQSHAVLTDTAAYLQHRRLAQNMEIFQRTQGQHLVTLLPLVCNLGCH